MCERSTRAGVVSETFGNADDFKLVTTQPADIQLHLEAADWCCEENITNLDEIQSHILPVKQQQNIEHQFKLNSKFLEGKNQQICFGKIGSAKISCKANNQKLCNRNIKTFYFFNGNVFVLFNTRHKLTSYVGYVIPVVRYGSMVKFINKTECKEKERI